MKKLLIVLAAAFVLCVPAFAVDSPVYFTATPYDVTLSGSSYYNFTSSDDVYFFWRIDSSGKYALFPISESNTAAYTQVIASATTDQFTTSQSFGDFYVTPAGQRPALISSSMFANIGYSPITAIFDQNATDADIQQAFADFLQGSSPVGAASSFTVPCGNVLYFKVDHEQDVTFTAVMPVLSSLLGTPTGAWNSGIQYGPAAALPTSGTTFPILSQDPINFAKTVSNQNLLGQTKNAISTKHCIAGQYYALYLPYHYGGWLALGSSHVYPDGSTSGGIVGANVTVSGSFAEIKVYPLTERANGDLLTGSVTLDSGSDDGFASYFDGEISETGTVTWLDQNGDISSPSVGGTSYVPEDVSTESIIDQIKNILSSIVSEIKNLFSFGYEAVNTLVGLMRDFVSVFQQLYEWLPSEVYSALISAIIVAITIGVFKVFL